MSSLLVLSTVIVFFSFMFLFVVNIFEKVRNYLLHKQYSAPEYDQFYEEPHEDHFNAEVSSPIFVRTIR